MSLLTLEFINYQEKDVSDYILAIDQGTSQTKALIMDRAGHVLATNAAPVHTNIIGETRIEQDPLDILRSVELACAPLLEQYPAEVAGLDNQGETFLLWDAGDGRAADAGDLLAG